jgi:glyoxylate reductase
MSKTVFITRKIPDVGIRMLKEKGYTVDIYPKDQMPTQKQLIRHLKKHPYDAVMCLLTDTIDSQVFDAVPTAKIFATFTVGYNNIDIEEANKRSITITNTAGASRTPVAEHAIALMLGLTTRMVEADNFTKKGKYKGWSPLAFMGTDFTGKTIGLVGTGSIGSEVARMARKGFGASIIYYDLVQNEILEKEFQATRCSTLDDLLKQADIVSLHVPLLDSTRHLIDEARLRQMKPTSFIVNTSRGPVIHEKDLVTALKNKTIAGAGLDVFEFEPKLSAGLNKLKNVILTPHIASARESARNQMAEIAAQNIIDFFEGKTPKNIVNP